MTGIMGMTRLLLDTPLDDKQKNWAKTIQYAGDALLGLLNNLLDLSKVEEGRMELESISFDLQRLCRQYDPADVRTRRAKRRSSSRRK